MKRRSLTLVSIAAGAVIGLAIAGLALARPAPVSPLALQTETDEVPPAQALVEGDRFTSEAWTLEIQESFRVSSPDRNGYEEVRVAAAFSNRLDLEIPFSSIALAGAPDYPALELRDGAGLAYSISRLTPLESSVPGSTLVALPSGVPARWTVGYQVPVNVAEPLTVEAVWQGNVVATWELTGAGSEIKTGWNPPPAAASAVLGDEVPWGTDLVVRPMAGDLQVCGNPSGEHAVVVYGLALDVDNPGNTDALWPNVRFPQEPAIAIWPDGSSARNGGIFTVETWVDFSGDGITRDPLDALGPEQVIIPPGTSAVRMLGFALPRDSRFGSEHDLPEMVALYAPGQVAPVWVDVRGDQLLDFAVSEDVCDEYDPIATFGVAPAG